MNIFVILLGILVGAIALLEGSLRYVGFGNPLLYQADPEMGYILSPNQNVRRMNKQILINNYSMRSDSVVNKRPENTLRIFLLGDSIANGGWWTDQEETISSLIQKHLKNSKYSQIEVLNASANSWGPRNQLAYLKRYGLFDSQVVILLLNTDDFFSSLPSSEKVGNDINYPNHKPALAISELLNRYLPSAKTTKDNSPKLKEKDNEKNNLAAIQDIYQVCQTNQAQLIIAVTPLLREVEQSSKDYEQRAKKRLTEFTQSQSIPLIDFLPRFKQINPPNSIYRDTIHITPDGNQIVSKTLIEEIDKIIKEKNDD
ncbi:SGNH/GDSL hydrolase family protein [Chroococcus sp. FPU101]|uniref:SGNH/GDSL hydrolase family protein n=1 Tax=Chroococcus sp. FPU101 TaxID=1974212 RepID=UPI001A8D9921|nr:SGNH/GDSL hydrolase family protein [Chroococcus sp. FPU101]